MSELAIREHRQGLVARLVVSDYERQRLRKEIRIRRLLRAAQWLLVLGAAGWVVYAMGVGR